MYTIEYGVKFFTAWAVPPEINFVTRFNILSDQMLDKIDIVSMGNMEVTEKVNIESTSSIIYPNTSTNTWSDCIIKTFRLEPFEENPEFNKIEFYIRYILTFRSIIDLLCFLPILVYIETYDNTVSNAYNILTAFRVIRLFKLLLSIKSIR